MVKIHLYILCCTLIISSCSNKSNFFQGDIVNENSGNIEKITLQGEKIWTDSLPNSIGARSIYIIDTFAIVKYSKQKYAFSVFHSKTFNKLGDFCLIGNGPSEFSSVVSFNGQYFKNSVGEYELYIFDINKKESYWINLNNSLLTNRTQSVLSVNYPATCFEPFSLKKDSITLFQEYQFRNHNFNLSIAQKEKVLKRIKLNQHSFEEAYGPLTSVCGINEDKFVMGMLMMNQINIIDLKTNSIKIIVPDMALTKWDRLQETSLENRTLYYTDLKYDDKYIYALYSNTKFSEYPQKNTSIKIKVYDWDGVLKKEFLIKETLQAFALSSDKKYLIGICMNESLFRYKLV